MAETKKNYKRRITKKQWVEALRSGDYKKGSGFLNKNNKFCCLGVACDLAGVAVDEERSEGWSDGTVSYLSPLDDHVNEELIEPDELAILVKDLRPKFPIDVPRTYWSKDNFNGTIEDGDDLISFLATQNDKGWTFNKIADWIERNL